MKKSLPDNIKETAKRYSKTKLYLSLFDDQPIFQIKSISIMPFLLILILFLLHVSKIVYIPNVETLVVIFMFILYIINQVASYVNFKLDHKYKLISSYRFQLFINIFLKFFSIFVFKTAFLIMFIIFIQDLIFGLILLFPMILLSHSNLISGITNLKEKGIEVFLRIVKGYKCKKIKSEKLEIFIQYLVGSKNKKQLRIFKAYSDYSNKVKAIYVSLFNSILLFDTLIDNFSFKEIKIALAHEIGHFKTKKSLNMLFEKTLLMRHTGIILAGILFIGNNPTVYGGFYFLVAIYTVNNLTIIYFNYRSKDLEKQADLFALRHTKDIRSYISMFKKLSYYNLRSWEYSTFFETISNDHPSVKERINYGLEYYQDIING